MKDMMGGDPEDSEWDVVSLALEGRPEVTDPSLDPNEEDLWG
jgi:hypothetical protein